MKRTDFEQKLGRDRRNSCEGSQQIKLSQNLSMFGQSQGQSSNPNIFMNGNSPKRKHAIQLERKESLKVQSGSKMNRKQDKIQNECESDNSQLIMNGSKSGLNIQLRNLMRNKNLVANQLSREVLEEFSDNCSFEKKRESVKKQILREEAELNWRRILFEEQLVKEALVRQKEELFIFENYKEFKIYFPYNNLSYILNILEIPNESERRKQLCRIPWLNINHSKKDIRQYMIGQAQPTLTNNSLMRNIVTKYQRKERDSLFCIEIPGQEYQKSTSTVIQSSQQPGSFNKMFNSNRKSKFASFLQQVPHLPLSFHPSIQSNRQMQTEPTINKSLNQGDNLIPQTNQSIQLLQLSKKLDLSYIESPTWDKKSKNPIAETDLQIKLSQDEIMPDEMSFLPPVQMTHNFKKNKVFS